MEWYQRFGEDDNSNFRQFSKSSLHMKCCGEEARLFFTNAFFGIFLAFLLSLITAAQWK